MPSFFQALLALVFAMPSLSPLDSFVAGLGGALGGGRV